MPQETQADFSGGLNTRFPAHRIGANQVTELQNADLSHGDLRGEYGSNTGGQSQFFYEAGESWVSSTGFTSADVILDWPYGETSTPAYSGSNTVTISSSTNYFASNPNARIKDGVTITINDGVTVTLYEITNGIHGAESYVEYNDDLFVARSSDGFSIVATTVLNDATVDTGDHTYKLQVGDELVNTTYFTAGAYIKSINISANTIEMSEGAKAAGTDQTYTVEPIISKFMDGVTTTSYRVGVTQPDPVFTISQLATVATQHTNRENSHSDSWYGTSDPIPFQYGISAYDETGVESTISALSDANLGAVGGVLFPDGSNRVPQSISIDGVAKYSAATLRDGRFALYRVGGTSAITMRLDNLFLDSTLQVSTSEDTNDLDVDLAGANSDWQYKLKWYVYKSGSTDYKYSNAGYNDPYDGTSRASTGETDWVNPSGGGGHTFTLDGNGTAHFVDIIVMMRIP